MTRIVCFVLGTQSINTFKAQAKELRLLSVIRLSLGL